jgi:hypothetical protein
MFLYEFFDQPREGMGFLGEKDVEEAGNANSGRRKSTPVPDNNPAKLGRIEKLKTGIKHHANPSRYGGYEPEADADHLLSAASRHRLHRAVTPDIDEDADLDHTVSFAQRHYPGSPNKQQAFMKFVQRSLQHSKEDDTRQNQEIAGLSDELENLKNIIQRLHNTPIK